MYRLRVLGGFALEGLGGAPISNLPQRRAMAVLAVLAVCGDLGCTRERLLALLWPESDEARARHGLRDALHAIRHALTPGSVPSSSSLLCLDPSLVSSDVQLFTLCLASGRLADAVQEYGGRLLEGFHLDGAPEFEHWLTGERARLERECAEVLEKLASSAEAAGAWAEAARWWARAVERDPLNSRFVLHHMNALSAIGDRANAIQFGELHLNNLREEFGLEADPSVLATIERIRRGELSVPPAAAADPPARSGTNGSQTAAMAHTDRAPLEAPGGDRRRAPAIPTRGRASSWLPWLAGIGMIVAAGAVIPAARRPSTSGADVRFPRTAIAVLPFHDLTADTAQAYFAIGLHDELLAQLADVVALRVIGSASVSGYRQTTKSPDQIGRELGVGSIVQGSVQVQGKRLRVIVQLIDPRTEVELWAETYDRPLDDVFAVQSDIAQRIVSAVGVTLSRAEAGGITTVPTANTEAYLLYLQGHEYAEHPGDRREDLAIAQRLYERAVQLDSTFALAHAALSTVHGRIFSRRLDESPARAEAQLREARAALRLAPSLPEAHVAMALTYCCDRYSDRRELEELTAALRHAPNDASLWGTISLIHARLGNWDSVDLAFEHARLLDPRNADLFQAQGNRLHCRRRYSEAIETYRRALVLAPDYVQPHLALAWSYILWKGQVDTLRAVLRGLPDIEPGGGAPRVGVGQATMLLWERRPDSLLTLLRSIRGDVWSSAENLVSRVDLTGSAYLLKGDTVAARAAFDSAVTLLDSAVEVNPGDARLHMNRGGLMAALGRRTEALREVRWLEQSDGYRNNHNCPEEPEARALILIRLGETDSAFAAIERLLAGPSRVSVHTIRLDPLWEPIPSNPRFQALLVKYANPGS